MKNTYLILLLLLLFNHLFSQEKKTPLVIGNGDYQYFPKLSKPTIEAKQMSDTLQKMGFEVILVQNATYDAFMDAITTFERILRKEEDWHFFIMGDMGFKLVELIIFLLLIKIFRMKANVKQELFQLMKYYYQWNLLVQQQI